MSVYHVTYDEYVAAGGTVSAEAFPAASLGADAVMNPLVRVPVETGEARADYTLAFTAVLNLQAARGEHEGIASERVGDTSVSYTSAADALIADTSLARSMLAGTGLLYRGLS